MGLLAYVNYSTLHEKTTDLMFDALKFDVAMVTQDGFDRLHKSIHYTYAWKYETEPADEAGEKTRSDNFMRALLTQVVVADNELEDYTPKYGNPAINFATDDMGSDKAMGGVLLDILVVIIAFIFAVTISNTIAKRVLRDRNTARVRLHEKRAGAALSVHAGYCNTAGCDCRKYTRLYGV